MDPKELLQTLNDFFISTQFYDKSVTLKTWFDKDCQLRFFITNTPPRRPNYLNTRTQVQTRLPNNTETCSRSSSTCSPSTPETARTNLHTNPLNVSIIEDERIVSDTNEISTPNIPTTNRFECLMSCESEPTRHCSPTTTSTSTPSLTTSKTTQTKITTFGKKTIPADDGDLIIPIDASFRCRRDASLGDACVIHGHTHFCPPNCEKAGKCSNYRSIYCRDCLLAVRGKNVDFFQR